MLTFLVGISLTTLGILFAELPIVPIPKSEELRNADFLYNSRIPLSEKKFWDNEILTRFGESPLEELYDSADESYRLVLLPTFDAPIVIHICRFENGRFLTTKKLSGEGGFGLENFGEISYKKIQSITEDEWNGFIELVNQTYFWDMPSQEKDDVPVMHPTYWVLEGIKDGFHHEVHRIKPNKEFSKRCGYLLKLSGLETENEGY